MTAQLFLLEPGFEKEDGNIYYCSSCATVAGFLSFFPQLHDAIEVTYLPFPRPRQRIIDLIGPDHQSLPVLVLADGEGSPGQQFQAQNINGRYFINGEARIREFLSARYDLPVAS